MKEIGLFIGILVGGVLFIGLDCFLHVLWPSCPDCGRCVTKKGDVCQDCAARKIRAAEQAKRCKCARCGEGGAESRSCGLNGAKTQLCDDCWIEEVKYP